MQSKRLIECMFYVLFLLVVRERPVTGQCITDFNCTSEIRRQTDEQILQIKNMTEIALLKQQDKIGTEMRRLADEQQAKLNNIIQMLEQLISPTLQPRKINYSKLCK